MDFNPNTLLEVAIEIAPRVVGALLVILGFWIAGIFAQRLANRLAQTSNPGRQDILKLLGQAAKVILLAVGLVSALGTLGINVTAMVAGLGLTGFALSFALKDVLANAVAGVLILFYQPFLRGDWISVKGMAGKVDSINLRYTTLIADDERMLIPNSVIFTESVRTRPHSD